MFSNEAPEERGIDEMYRRFEHPHARKTRFRHVAARAVRQLQHDGEYAARLQPSRDLLHGGDRIDVFEKERRMDEIDRSGIEIERSEIRADELQSGDIPPVPFAA